ncbi:hypothetical protein ACR6C2_02410 [Streptomyces sp. INA 01156]
MSHLSGEDRRDGRTDADPVIAVISGGRGWARPRWPCTPRSWWRTGTPRGRTAAADQARRHAAVRRRGGRRTALRTPLRRSSRIVPGDTRRCRAPDQVRGLLGMTGCGAFVVTSRMRLAALVATHGPAVLELGALPPQESHALLVAVLGHERVAAETTAAHALTDTCGHVPLALRIVAARLLTRPKLRLADHAAWLRRDLPARLALPDDVRMSVPLTLDGALDRLPAPVADAHLCLARLDGQITAPAARALSVPETHAEELLERLLDTGLLDEEHPERSA